MSLNQKDTCNHDGTIAERVKQSAWIKLLRLCDAVSGLRVIGHRLRTRGRRRLCLVLVIKHIETHMQPSYFDLQSMKLRVVAPTRWPKQYQSLHGNVYALVSLNLEYIGITSRKV
jgi:hypothetical protein